MTFDAEGVRARLAAAAPGPWFTNEPGPYIHSVWSKDRPEDVNPVNPIAKMVGPDDARLIAHAPTDLAAALDRITELEAALAAAEGHVCGNATPAVHLCNPCRLGHHDDCLRHTGGGCSCVGSAGCGVSLRPFFAHAAAEGARLAAERGLAGEGTDARSETCVAAWPECYSGGYDPRCCRFPKSCSCSSEALR